MEKLCDVLKNEVCCFKGPGIATLVMHKSKADTMFNKSSLQLNYQEELDLPKVATKIKNELKELPYLINSIRFLMRR